MLVICSTLARCAAEPLSLIVQVVQKHLTFQRTCVGRLQGKGLSAGFTCAAGPLA